MKQILILIIAFGLGQNTFSQNRAPSCWLKYKDSFQGDILVNTVRVPAPSPTYTYYCTLQWNAGMEGGGYCGIQEHPDSRNFIYSIWDPKSSNEAITAAYAHPGTKVENFGGEGTGLKSWNFEIGWETNQWYSFVSRAWGSNAHTMFGYWVFDHTNSIWHHLVTMDFPVANVRFNSSTGSFIEDWLGNGWNTREVHHKEGWKRRTSDNSWYAFTSAKFERVKPDAGAINYIDNYDGGINTDHYFMQSGGIIIPETNSSGATVYLDNSATDPGLETGQIFELNSSVTNDTTLSLSWVIDLSRAPQFSYHVKIFDNQSFAGDPVIEASQNTPHLRDIDINLNGLRGDTVYYLQFYIEDIFDNKSAVKTDSFRTNPSLAIERNEIIHNVTVYPNPVHDKINIISEKTLKNLELQLMSILGNVVYEKEYQHISELIVPVNNIPNGIYFLRLLSEKRIKTIKLIKK